MVVLQSQFLILKPEICIFVTAATPTKKPRTGELYD